MTIEYVQLTDKGLVRETNQDAVYTDIKGSNAFFVVADGMGGHSHGERASQEMTEELARWWQELDHSDLPQAIDLVQDLVNRICVISRNIYDEFELQQEKGGTTLCAAVILGNTYILVTVGDSRVYGYEKKENKMTLLTRDDVWQNLPGVRRELTESQKRADPRYGQLTQAAGYDKDIIPRVVRGFLEKGDVMLLCTDGIYKPCQDKELLQCMKGSMFRKDLQKRMEVLQKKVLEQGAKDNYSLVLFEMK